jgi:NRAMP (natural resistance-associated macrophage protein)-like metal ion transporter
MRLRQRRTSVISPAGSVPLDTPSKKTGFRRFFSILGPGLVTGAADDDPSGIVTYSIAGAQLGTRMLWVALLSWPLMCAVQMMCARIGLVTGGGLANALRKKFPKPVLIVAGLALFIANTINIGADLSGMADVSNLLTGIPNGIWVVAFGAAIIFATVRFRYSAIANILKWLAVFLFAYVITAFLVHPNWHTILRDTFLPSAIRSHDEWATLVAILGTTISPYLFFWQASQEIEEEKAKGHLTVASRQGAPDAEINERKLDVGIGGFFSNIIMYFIILTTALTLHTHAATQHIETSKDAVQALKPLAGQFAALLYATGLIGVGFLAIPTLAGSAAYAFTETFGFRQGLDETLLRARAFYGILVLSVALGIGLSFSPIKAVDQLFWTAVINGVLAPFLLVGILLVACDREIMQNQPSSMLGRVVVGVTAAGMFAAAIALFTL